jgi:hypothetical protein
MPLERDDAAAALVRAAARQLCDRRLRQRYVEEWLASMPTRSGYLRWRYALSLALRGARATDRAIYQMSGQFRIVRFASVWCALGTAAAGLLILSSQLLASALHENETYYLAEISVPAAFWSLAIGLAALIVSRPGARHLLIIGLTTVFYAYWADVAWASDLNLILWVVALPGTALMFDRALSRGARITVVLANVWFDGVFLAPFGPSTGLTINVMQAAALFGRRWPSWLVRPTAETLGVVLSALPYLAVALAVVFAGRALAATASFARQIHRSHMGPGR